jgi:hypothetical protein
VPAVAEPAEPGKKAAEPKRGTAAKTTQNSGNKTKSRADDTRPKPPQNVAPPRPASPLGWLR